MTATVSALASSSLESAQVSEPLVPTLRFELLPPAPGRLTAALAETGVPPGPGLPDRVAGAPLLASGVDGVGDREGRRLAEVAEVDGRGELLVRGITFLLAEDIFGREQPCVRCRSWTEAGSC